MVSFTSMIWSQEILPWPWTSPHPERMFSMLIDNREVILPAEISHGIPTSQLLLPLSSTVMLTYGLCKILNPMSVWRWKNKSSNNKSRWKKKRVRTSRPLLSRMARVGTTESLCLCSWDYFSSREKRNQRKMKRASLGSKKGMSLRSKSPKMRMTDFQALPLLKALEITKMKNLLTLTMDLALWTLCNRPTKLKKEI